MKKFPIDLSCLTEEEIYQFQEDPYTLYNGDQDVALYLRYSSTGQSDQSIEGQLRDCRTFCKANHYRIVAIYVDRATTARKDVEKRVHLMEMVADSAKQNWEYVIVWKLDRFARNRNDSAIMKMRLRKNGVKVLSATEHLTDSPESIILESVLEGMAEFFSAELSQKVTRGMRESALKCHSVGGHIPLGYKVENHKLVIDPDTAHIVQEAFSLYANGESVADICRKFNSAGYKTAKNTEFNRSSFKAMFRNTRYIGTYTYKDIVIENGIPAIIDKELFETVQRRLSKTATAPARGKAKVDYLLSGKLFCGHCGASMNGESGAGRHGKVYHYYSCYTKKRKLGCDKRPLKKDYIEGIVARDALNLLTDQLIDEIADMAIRQSEQDLINDTHIPQLTAQLSEVEKSITNITAAIEKGIASETLMNRLVQLEHEKKTLNKEIKAEEKFVYRIDRDQIVFWLSQFKYGNIEDEDFRRRLIDLLVNSVTVWDEPDGYKITTAYNLTSCKTKTFRVEKNPAAEEATGFDFGESECTKKKDMTVGHVFLFGFRSRWSLHPSVFQCSGADGSAPQAGQHGNDLLLPGHDLGQEGAVLLLAVDVKGLADGVLIPHIEQLRAVQQHVGDHQQHRVHLLLLTDGLHGLQKLVPALEQAVGVHAGDLADRQIVSRDMKLLIICVQHGLHRLVVPTGSGEDGLPQLIQRDVGDAGHAVSQIDVPLGTGGRLEHHGVRDDGRRHQTRHLGGGHQSLLLIHPGHDSGGAAHRLVADIDGIFCLDVG